jgi:hypothetical protein
MGEPCKDALRPGIRADDRVQRLHPGRDLTSEPAKDKVADPIVQLMTPLGFDDHDGRFIAPNSTLGRLATVILVVTAVKCLLAWLFPFMGDEMFLTLQAGRLGLGYYDHPPAIMWILHGLLSLGRSPLLLRLPTIVVMDVIAIILYLLLRPYDRHRAYLASVLVLVCPLNTAFFMISTETPLMLASFSSASLLFLAEKRGRYAFYVLSGLCLGLAFLSKYLAVLLGLSYLVFFVSMPASRRRWRGFALLAVASLPAVAVNVLWNYANGWPNIMHNWVNRFRPETNGILNLLSLVVVLLYFLTVPLILFLFKNRRALVCQFRRPEFRVMSLAFLVPLLVFLVVSLRKAVGVHWLLSFLPLVYVLVALPFSIAQIHKCIRFAVVISTLQVGLVLVASLAARYAPVHRFRDVLSPRDMATVVLFVRPRQVLDEIEREIRQGPGGYVLATKSYQFSALLQYCTGRRVIVLGKGSNHAREDDILTDFRTLDGRDFLILYKAASDEDECLPWFLCSEARLIETEGARFTLVKGYGFKYRAYREGVLRAILERYYRIPDWLPGSRDFFREKYGFEAEGPSE